MLIRSGLESQIAAFFAVLQIISPHTHSSSKRRLKPQCISAFVRDMSDVRPTAVNTTPVVIVLSGLTNLRSYNESAVPGVPQVYNLIQPLYNYSHTSLFKKLKFLLEVIDRTQ